MHWIIAFMLCHLALFTAQRGVHAAREIQVQMQMREETPPSTRIGSIAPSLPVDLGQKLHFLTDGSFFSVSPVTGEVRVARLIDRERLCPEYKLCCGVIKCELDARVFVTNKATGEFAATVNLKVDIQDQNDNRPVFPTPTQTVRVSEASPLGTQINMIPATDADTEPMNQIQRYTLIEPTGTFILDLTALPAVRLQLTRPLDRETTAAYTATLEACDPGACARQTVEIEILDENDNHPQFVTNRISKQLMENIDVGQVVLQLNATDADSGERGRILFSFHGTVDPDLQDTFELVQETGEIRLKRPLAANIRSNYRFKVVACDAVLPACSGGENSTAEVDFNVKDMNNFAPSIHAVAAGVALNPTDSTGTAGQPGSEARDGLSIMENTPPSQVAVLTVRDDDLGENARVTCVLSDAGPELQSLSGVAKRKNFVLTPSAPGIYSLRTAREFDFELEPTVSTKVVCHDYGQPQQLTSARVIVVRVLDVNEFQPEFSRRVYVGRVPENAPAGMEVLTTTATDRDRGASLHYFFAPPVAQLGGTSSIGGGQGGSSSSPTTWSFGTRGSSGTDESDPGVDKMGVNKYFVMESETGIIRTSHVSII
ncbi:Protocadherin 18 [Fasciola hepatica]|uniref:Protocadherin 18 n=1 Tax=Fasciola hepatica TaxID=6192 RepID=A0A2H1CYA1_FASHE|nr:Protocadherin 18 [Fasciola hepatica]